MPPQPQDYLAELFSIVEKLCQALQTAEECIPDESRRRRSMRLINKARDLIDLSKP